MTYAKSGAALVATLLSAVLAALTGDGVIDPVEWVNVAILFVGALNVLYVANTANAPVAKAFVAATGAALTALAGFIVGGVDLTEGLQMAVAALGALGVYAVRNAPQPASPEAIY